MNTLANVGFDYPPPLPNKEEHMPAVSADQWQFMEQVCKGTVPPPSGMTQQQACEYISTQPSPEGLPQRAATGTALGERGSDYLTGAYSKGA